MKVKWTLILDEAHGSVDKKHYARGIPGNGAYAAVCNKPELSDKTRKAKANHPTAKALGNLTAACKPILNTPERRAAWEALYEKDKREARRHNKYIQGRLCDYVRHKVSVMLKNGEEIVP